MKTNNTPHFTVVMKSAGGCEKELYHFDSFARALNFCTDHQWEFKDDNDFVWDLVIQDNFKAE